MRLNYIILLSNPVVQCGEDKDKSSWVWGIFCSSIDISLSPLQSRGQKVSQYTSPVIKSTFYSPLENIFLVTQLDGKTGATKTMLPCLPGGESRDCLQKSILKKHICCT